MSHADHVVAVEGGSFKCLHCFRAQAMAMPCDLDIWVAASRVFLEKHRDCPPPSLTGATDGGAR